MEVGEQSIHAPKLMRWMNEQAGASSGDRFKFPAARSRTLQSAQRGGPDRQDPAPLAACFIDQGRGLAVHREPLFVHPMLSKVGHLHRRKSAKPHVERE